MSKFGIFGFPPVSPYVFFENLTFFKMRVHISDSTIRRLWYNMMNQSRSSLAVSYGNANIIKPVARNKAPLIQIGVLVPVPDCDETTGAAIPQAYPIIAHIPLTVALIVDG
jgi:hypothetical protein